MKKIGFWLLWLLIVALVLSGCIAAAASPQSAVRVQIQTCETVPWQDPISGESAYRVIYTYAPQPMSPEEAFWAAVYATNPDGSEHPDSWAEFQLPCSPDDWWAAAEAAYDIVHTDSSAWGGWAGKAAGRADYRIPNLSGMSDDLCLSEGKAKVVFLWFRDEVLPGTRMQALLTAIDDLARASGLDPVTGETVGEVDEAAYQAALQEVNRAGQDIYSLVIVEGVVPEGTYDHLVTEGIGRPIRILTAHCKSWPPDGMVERNDPIPDITRFLLAERDSIMAELGDFSEFYKPCQ
ncbi:hypothetical protein KKB83_01215 [Patescibacteria group bacterium]|nr:hypothetical protein [Patescibacteria group bacterium]